MKGGRRFLAVAGVSLAAMGLAVAVLLPRTTLVGIQRRGSAVAATADGTPVVVTMLQREMNEVVVEGVSLRSIPRLRTLVYFTPVLVAHDARSGAPRWERQLARIDWHAIQDQTRLLGADGDRVWVFAAGIAAVAAASGVPVADGAALAAANPPLRGVVPSEGRWFEIDAARGGLVVTAADGRVWRIDAATLAATPTTKESRHTIGGDYLRGLQRWNAGPAVGHAPHDYTLEGDLLERQWVGLLAAEDAPRIGPLLSQPQRPGTDPPRRRCLWYADAFVEDRLGGRTWSVRNLGPVEGSDEFLQGGLLRDGGRLGVLRVEAPDGFLVLHTDRLGDGGRYLLSRIDARGRTLWTAALPLRWINDLLPLRETLVMLGPDRASPHQGDAHETLVSLDLDTGRCRAWDYRLGAALETTCAAPATTPADRP